MGNNLHSARFMKMGLFAVLGRRGRVSMAVLAFVLTAPRLALAHGSMSGDELGPPLLTSGVLGFLSYWVVMLWPSSRKKGQGQGGARQSQESGPHLQRRSPKPNARRMRRPHLRVIEPGDQFAGDQQTRRKASDG